MLMGIPWYAVVGVAVLFASVFTVVRRKNAAGSFGEPGAEAAKLGRLY